MKRRFLVYFTVILTAAVYFLGCSASQYNFGWEQIYAKNYDEAILVFNQQIAKDRASYPANFGLGVAYYFTNNLDKAIKYLETANSLKLTNTEVKYYIGLCYEVKKDYRNAIKYFRYYNDKTLDGKYSKEMENRLVFAIRALYNEEVIKLINEEKEITSKLSDSTVAILTFENRSSNEEFDPMEKGFPGMFITDFSHVPKLKIVERLRMQSILDELKLNQSALIDPGTLQRVGYLLRAKNIIKGGFLISNNTTLRLDLALISVESGRVMEQFEKTGVLDDFYRMEKDLTLEIIDKMGIKISNDIRQKILTIPTESFFEFLEKIKALDRLEKISPKQAPTVLNEAFDLNLSMIRLNSIESSISDQKDDPRDEIILRTLPAPPQPPK